MSKGKNRKIGVSSGEKYARVELVATPGQKALWEGSARACGLSLSAWLSFVADRAVVAQEKEGAEW